MTWLAPRPPQVTLVHRGKPLLHDHLEVGTMQFLVLRRQVGDDALLSPAREG